MEEIYNLLKNRKIDLKKLLEYGFVKKENHYEHRTTLIKDEFDIILIFDKDAQDTHSGGSGCGCVGSVFSGYFYRKLKEGSINRILLMATGALMNSTSSQQGESIPGIAHAISIENLNI